MFYHIDTSLNIAENLKKIYFLLFAWTSTAVTKRRNSGNICKILCHGIFNQKLKSASDIEFYSLYDAIHEFAKFEFS
jgi:hypothetical protein